MSLSPLFTSDDGHVEDLPRNASAPDGILANSIANKNMTNRNDIEDNGRIYSISRKEYISDIIVYENENEYAEESRQS
jgi:hypothetical protein